jgi:hypothetical protein
MIDWIVADESWQVHAKMEEKMTTVQLVALRIIRSHDSFPEANQEIVERSARIDNWDVTVRFGPLEPTTILTLATCEAVKAPVLDFSLSNRSLEHFNSMENSIQARIDSYKLPPEWQDPAKLYTTIKALRNIEEPSTAQGLESQYFLVMNSTFQQLFDRHEEEADLVLGFAVARLLLAEKYRIVGPEFKSRPQLYLLKGKSSSRIPVRFTSSASAVVTRATLSQVTDEIESIPFEGKLDSQIVKSIGTIGRWYLAALNERDQFKQFMWSYSALEYIFGKVAKASREDLSRSLASTSQGLGTDVIEQLLWPKDNQDRDPNRSIKFRCAAAVAVLSPSTASNDFIHFTHLYNYRNMIHGSLRTSSTPPALLALQMLERYALLATRYLATVSRPA